MVSADPYSFGSRRGSGCEEVEEVVANPYAGPLARSALAAGPSSGGSAVAVRSPGTQPFPAVLQRGSAVWPNAHETLAEHTAKSR